MVSEEAVVGPWGKAAAEIAAMQRSAFDSIKIIVEAAKKEQQLR